MGIHVTSGPALERKGDLAGLLTNLNERDVLFIDEIHRLNAAVEEYLYPAMEDFRLDITIDTGPAARAMKIDLPPFTLIGATTRTGLLTSPLRDRFQIQERLEYYEPKLLEHILDRSARILGVPLDRAASREISTRSRGTPRIANRLLRRLRDFAQVEGDGRITYELAHGSSLGRLGVDASGLDAMDRKILLTIVEKFGGGPVGVETIAASVGEQRDTIEDVYEPFLCRRASSAHAPRTHGHAAHLPVLQEDAAPRFPPGRPLLLANPRRHEPASAPTVPTVRPGPRDFYADLMRASQATRAGFLAERERWLRGVPVEGREELLFEFEMLLRAVERYLNLHNAVVDARARPLVTRDFHEELADVRDAMERAVRVARHLQDPDSDPKMVFRKYVETQLADDRVRRP